jgi:hypothetical protein
MFTNDGGKRVRAARDLAAHMEARPKGKTVVSPTKKGDPSKRDFIKKKAKKSYKKKGSKKK